MKIMGKIYSVHTNQKKKVENEIIDVKNLKRPKLMEKYTMFTGWKTHYC